jgi:glycosyltransferase involved in cell wall biosynthesis
MPLASRKHRAYLPLMPLAVEQMDVSAYDLVISSSYLVAKGVLTGPNQLHVCYCHTPARFAWDLQNQYLGKGKGIGRRLKSMFARVLLHYIRNWDTRSATGVDVFVSNSQFISRRIAKAYRRDSVAIYPPVDIQRFTPGADKEQFYLTASRLVPYKRIDLIIQAFNLMPSRRLVVIGDGPDLEKMRALAKPNVTVLGHQPFAVLKDYLQRARAFVFAAEEDFGIAPVEAQACGTPVIAFGRGGVTESVLDGQTGIFFDEQSAEAIVDAVARFEGMGPWDAALIRQNSERFSADRFRREIKALVDQEWACFERRSATRRMMPVDRPDGPAVEVSAEYEQSPLLATADAEVAL